MMNNRNFSMKHFIYTFLIACVAFFGVGFLRAHAQSAPSITNQTAVPSQTSAVLSGSVNPNGATTTVWYETPSGGPYGTHTIGSGTSSVSTLPYTLSGLSANTTYTFRVVTSNSAGTINGPWISFTTTGNNNPVVSSPTITSQSSNPGQTSAVFSGSVNPNNGTTTVWYETPNGGPFGTHTIGNGNSSVSTLPYTLSGLSAGTTYTFRIVASNSAGTINGAWQTFTTTGNQPPQTGVPTIVSAVATPSQTSAVFSGSVNPNGLTTTVWYETPSGGPYGTHTIGSGTSSVSTLPYTLSGLIANTTYTFRIVASNSMGVVNGSWVSFATTGNNNNTTTSPTISTTTATSVGSSSATLRGSVDDTGNLAVTRWFEWGTSQNNLNNTLSVSGTQSSVGSFNRSLSGLSSNDTYYFKACGSNSLGNDCGATFSFTTNSSSGGGSSSSGGGSYSNNNQWLYPTVSTLFPTSINTASASITGTVNANNSSTNAWFEYGTSMSFGMNTQSVTYGANVTSTTFGLMSPLSPNTRYYYRIVAENSAGRVYGATIAFTTPPVYVPGSGNNGSGGSNGGGVTIIQTENSGSTPYIRLTIENGADVVNAGSISAYQIEWENISNTILSNAVLRVILPQEVTYLGTTSGTYNQNEHAITVNLGTVRPDDEGRFTVTTQAKTTGTSGDTIVAQTMMAFTTPGEAQHTAMNYDDDIYYSTVLGTGASLFGLTFLPNTLLGWMVLLLVLVLVIVVARKILKSQESKRVSEQDIRYL